MTKEELFGSEFDWFALDANNNVALFATAGFGYIPDAVIQSYDDHADITDFFLTPHWGSEGIWDDYAKYGLFVYDWVGASEHYATLPDCYVKVREPAQEMPEDLKDRILSISGVQKFPVDFRSSEVITREVYEPLP